MRRSPWLDLFLVAWIAGQLALAIGASLAGEGYLQGPFTWAMFARERLHYEAALFAVDGAGARVAIDGLERVARHLPGPEPEPRIAPYQSEADVLRRLRGIVDHLAAERADGRLYGAELRWLGTHHPAQPARWSYAARAAPGNP